MALMMIDGFDEYLNAPTKYIGGTQGQNDLSGSKSRTGIGAWHAIGPNGPYTSFVKRTTLILGLAVSPANPPGQALFQMNVGGVFNINAFIQAQLYINADGSVSVVNRNVPFQATLGTSAPGLVLSGVYNYIEMKVFCNPTTGSVQVRINGALVLNLTNVNTDPTSQGGIDTVMLNGPTGGLTSYYDDMYLCDNSGGTNNDFLGAVRVYTALPVSDNSPLQWTPSTGVTHFNLVNGVPAESQTTYVQDLSIGNVDQYLYNVSAIPAGVQILGVQHGLYASLDASGSGSVGSECGGTLAGSAALTTVPHIYSFPRDTDPVVSGPWTMANLISRQFGPNRTA